MGLSKKRKIGKKTHSLRKIHVGSGPMDTINLGIYDFSGTTIEKLYVCSDLEGSNPFKFEDSDKVYDMKMEKKIHIKDIEMKDGKNRVLTDPMVKSTVASIFKDDLVIGKQNTIKEGFNLDGIITNIGEKVALAYTGDLFDNRPYSLRLLKAMIQLKESKKNRVIIIGGNRDYNKLRLGIELFMVDNNGIHPFQKPADGKLPTLEILVNSQDLKYEMTNVPQYLNHDRWKKARGSNDTIYEFFDTEKTFSPEKSHQRFMMIVDKSMGAKSEAYSREVKDIFSNKLTDTPKKINKLLSLLFMAMCFDWGEIPLVSNDDEDGKKFNSMKGLIYRYMQLMHPVAYFDFGEDTGKNGFLSHSGVMDFTAPLGFNPDAGTNETDMTKIMTLLLDDKNRLLDEYNLLKDNIENIKVPNRYLTLVRYIGITAPPHDDHSIVIKGPVATNKFTKLNLPRVGGSGIYDEIFTIFPTNKFKDTYPVSTLRLIGQEGQPVKYNIFGHQPQYLVPTVNQQEHTYNIALDVCKSDFKGMGNNNYSFAILQINKKNEDNIFGRTRVYFDKNLTLEKYILHYYYKPITDDFFKKTKGLVVIGEEKYKGIPFFGDDLIIPPTITANIGGSKHICSKNCKKCHKHDQICMLKCRLCHDHMIVKKSSKVRKSRKAKKARKTRNVVKRMVRKTRKNVKRRSQKHR